MSATDKDINSKPKEDDISALLDDDIDDNDHDNDNNDTTHLAPAPASASDKRPGSPQVTPKKDSPRNTTVNDDDDDDEEDINIHSSSTSPAVAATVTPVAPLTTSATVASPPAPAPALAQLPANPAQSEREARLAILTEAFPTVEKEVCEFVLESHRGDVEASINALLEISDPEFHAEPAPAPQPVRAPAPAPAPAPARVPSSDAPPALPRRHTNDLDGQMGNLNLDGQNQQPQRDIDVRQLNFVACH